MLRWVGLRCSGFTNLVFFLDCLTIILNFIICNFSKIIDYLFFFLFCLNFIFVVHIIYLCSNGFTLIFENAFLDRNVRSYLLLGSIIFLFDWGLIWNWFSFEFLSCQVTAIRCVLHRATTCWRATISGFVWGSSVVISHIIYY